MIYLTFDEFLNEDVPTAAAIPGAGNVSTPTSVIDGSGDKMDSIMEPHFYSIKKFKKKNGNRIFKTFDDFRKEMEKVQAK